MLVRIDDRYFLEFTFLLGLFSVLRMIDDVNMVFFLGLLSAFALMAVSYLLLLCIRWTLDKIEKMLMFPVF